MAGKSILTHLFHSYLKFIFHSPFNCLSQLLKNTMPLLSLNQSYLSCSKIFWLIDLQRNGFPSLSISFFNTLCDKCVDDTIFLTHPLVIQSVRQSCLCMHNSSQSHFSKHITPLKPLHRISRNFEAMRKFKFLKIFWEYILHTFSTWKKINWPLLNNMHAFT